jgi:hypothetical protein
MIEPALIEQIRRDLNSAPYTMRTAMAGDWARMLGIVPQTLYMELRGETNGRGRKGTPKRPEYQEWTRTVSAIKKSPPEGAGEISTDQAVAMGVQWGKLPKEALEVPVGTFDRIARDMGLNKKLRKVSRFQAERPNQLHHFDASSSKFLYIHSRVSEDDFIIKIHRPGSGDYKNKPIPCDRLRPWYYGVVDDHSGRMHGTLVAAAGENSLHSIQAVCNAWAVMGVPDALLADQGMLKKGLISKDLIARLNVELPESMPYAKEAHGKIERTWRTGWQRFEKPFYAGDWKKFTILFSELKQQFETYLADDYNQLAHRFDKGITKMQAWSRINLYGGIVEIPENAIATAARRIERTVDQDGTLQIDGQTYEVKHLHSAKVVVFMGVVDGKIIVQDKADGKKYEVRAFKPLNVGEYKGHLDTPHQKLIKEFAPQLTGSAPMLYAEKKEASVKVASMPIRTKEERVIEDPFDVDSFADINEAMREFMTYLPGIFLSTDERREVEETIGTHGLSRSFVGNFALEVRANLSKRAAM